MDIVNYNLISYDYFATLEQGNLKRYSCLSLLCLPVGGLPSLIFPPPSPLPINTVRSWALKECNIHATKMMVKCNLLANLTASPNLGLLGMGLGALELCHSQILPTRGRGEVTLPGKDEPRLRVMETRRVVSP